MKIQKSKRKKHWVKDDQSAGNNRMSVGSILNDSLNESKRGLLRKLLAKVPRGELITPLDLNELLKLELN